MKPGNIILGLGAVAAAVAGAIALKRWRQIRASRTDPTATVDAPRIRESLVIGSLTGGGGPTAATYIERDRYLNGYRIGQLPPNSAGGSSWGEICATDPSDGLVHIPSAEQMRGADAQLVPTSERARAACMEAPLYLIAPGGGFSGRDTPNVAWLFGRRRADGRVHLSDAVDAGRHSYIKDSQGLYVATNTVTGERRGYRTAWVPDATWTLSEIWLDPSRFALRFIGGQSGFTMVRTGTSNTRVVSVRLTA